MYTPINLSSTIQQWGLRGSKLYTHVFVSHTHTEASVFDVPPILKLISLADERDETDDESEASVFDVPPILELITPADER